LVIARAKARAASKTHRAPKPACLATLTGEDRPHGLPGTDGYALALELAPLRDLPPRFDVTLTKALHIFKFFFALH